MELLEQLEHFSLYSHFSLLCNALRLLKVFQEAFHRDDCCSMPDSETAIVGNLDVGVRFVLPHAKRLQVLPRNRHASLVRPTHAATAL